MSETNSHRASLVSIIAIFVLFGLFLAVMRYMYVPRQTGTFADDGIRTVEQRQKTLAELHAKEAAQAKSYSWVDQKTGVVHLPLERAMELTLQKYAAKP